MTHERESTPHARRGLLSALLHRTEPVPRIREQLAQLPWDSEPLIQLRDAHLLTALSDYLDGAADAESLEEWADAVEVRDDIEFTRELHIEIVYELATPYAAGPLTPDVARAMQRRILRDPAGADPV